MNGYRIDPNETLVRPPLSLRMRAIIWLTSFALVFGSSGGPALADTLKAHHDRVLKANEVARNLSIDPLMITDPDAWQEKEAKAAEKRRVEAVAAMQKKYGPDPAKLQAHHDLVEQTERAHLPDRLGGLANTLNEAQASLERLGSGPLTQEEMKREISKVQSLGIIAKSAMHDLDQQVDFSTRGMKKGTAQRIETENRGNKVRSELGNFADAANALASAKPEQIRTKLEGVTRSLRAHVPAPVQPPPPVVKKTPIEPIAPRELTHELWRTGQLTPEVRDFYTDMAGEDAYVPTPAGLMTPDSLAKGFNPDKVPPVLWAGPILQDSVSILLNRAMGALPAPVADDLAETPDVHFTPALQALATQLGSDPLALYNYVHDQLDSEVYEGSRMGSEGALQNKAGNDFDLSSLLVALLRYTGTPARYEYGSVHLSPDQAMGWTGAQTPSAAATFLASAGIPTKVTWDPAGNVVALDVEHVWVRAYVPMGGYRGIESGADEKAWVRLDPTLKRYQNINALDLRGAVTFDFAAYRSAIQTKTPLDVFEDQLRAYALAHGQPCRTLDDLTVKRTLQPDALEVLPTDLPARINSTLLVFASVPDTMRLKARYKGGGIDYTFALPAIWGQRLGLRWAGATQADRDTIAAAGGVRQVAPYSVNVVPQLQLEGATVATGSSIRPGTDVSMDVLLSAPRLTQAPSVHSLRAGGAYALMVDAAGIPRSLVDNREAALSSLSPSASDEDKEEARAQLAVARYFQEDTDETKRLYAEQRFAFLHDVNVGMATRKLDVTELFGQPVALSTGNWLVDIPRAGGTPFSLDDDRAPTTKLALSLIAGYQMSTGEHRIWEEVSFGQALSAVRVLEAAASTGVQILTIDSNSSGQISGLPYSSVAKTDITNLVHQGMRVTVPASAPNYGSFSAAVGYVAEDLTTGAGAYRLLGTANGGEGPDGSAPDGGSGCNCSTSNIHGGSLIDAKSGSYEHTETDLSLPGRGLPIVLSRTYRSRTTQPFSSVLGAQWQHSYAAQLRFEQDGSVSYIDETLREWRFTPNGSGSWTRPSGYHSQLAALEAGGYRLTELGGKFRDFDAAGHLVGIEDLSGNRVSIVLDAFERPAQVHDAANRVVLTFAYGPDGLLQSATDIAGRQVLYQHQATDLSTVTDVLGNDEAFEYDDAHHLITKTDKRGKATTLTYDRIGRWTGLVDPLGFERHVSYDPLNHRAVFQDKRGSSTIWEYDEASHPVGVTDPDGNLTAMAWDADGNKLTQTGARGSSSSMTYDGDGNLLTTTDPLNHTTSYTYDAGGRPLTRTDPLNHSTTYTYDEAGRLATSSNEANELVGYGYDTAGQIATITQADSATTSLAHNPDGTIASVTDPSARVMLLSYDAYGHLASRTDPGGHSQTLTTDKAGNVQAMTDAQQNTISLEYDAAGNRTAIVDPNGKRTSFVFDELNRVISVTDPLSNVTRVEYEPEGQVSAQIDPRGGRTERVYDPSGRLAATLSPSGAATTLGYCAEMRAQPCAIADPLGNLTQVTFNAAGQPVATVDPTGVTTGSSYDAASRLQAQTDGSGHSTTYAYDPTGRLQGMEDALQNVTSYDYDSHGNRTTIHNAAGGTFTFGYDVANRLNSLSRGGTTESYTYNDSGERSAKTEAGGEETTYEYDPEHRLTSTTFADGSSNVFAYNAAGQLIAARGPDHAQTFEYGDNGRVKKATDETLGQTIQYSYDSSGNRTRMQFDDATHVDFAWDSSDRLVAVTDKDGGRYTLSYDAAGRRTELRSANGDRTAYEYDAAGRPAAAVTFSRLDEVLLGLSYSYDAAGRVQSTRFADGTQDEYGYDAAGRLVDVTYGAGYSVHYERNGLGSVTSKTVVRNGVSATEDVTYDSIGRIATVSEGDGVTLFNYDPSGRLSTLTNAGNTLATYSWDLDGRLRTVQRPGFPESSYSYTAKGTRFRVTEGGHTTDQLLDGDSVVAEFEQGVRTSDFLRSDQEDEYLRVQHLGDSYFPHADRLGNVLAADDSLGNVAAKWSYDVYGERSSIPLLGGADLSWLTAGFTGREQGEGASANLTYHRDRYLDTEHGVWLQPDRMSTTAALSDISTSMARTFPEHAWRMGGVLSSSVSDGATPYEYSNAPTLFVDPTGFSPTAPRGCSTEEWIGAPLFYAEMATGVLALVFFAGIYSSLDTGNQVLVVSAIGEGGLFVDNKHVPYPSAPEVGVAMEAAFGLGYEDASRIDFDDEVFVEGVVQVGPVVTVVSGHGLSVFITPVVGLGAGALVGSPTTSHVYDL